MLDNPLETDFWGALRPNIAWMHRQLRRLGVHASDLDDVTQETLITLHRRREQYDPSRSLRAYLFGYLFRVAADYRRRSFRRHERQGVIMPMHSGAPSPEDDAESRGELELVQRALDMLPEGRREVFVMAVIAEHTIPEVAEALEIPLNTAYSRLRVARQEFAAAVHEIRKVEQ